MAYDIYTVSGVILEIWNQGEWNKKFSFLSKEYGIIVVTAIGAQRPASKMRGYINRFSSISIDVVHGKSGYRLVRARNTSSGLVVYKKESYFILARVSKLLQGLLPIGAPHPESFFLFTSLCVYLQNTIVLESNADKIFYETALRLLSLLGYRKGHELGFSLSTYNEFDLRIQESTLMREYELILSENGLSYVI